MGAETITRPYPIKRSRFSHSRRQRFYRRSQITKYEDQKIHLQLKYEQRELTNTLNNIDHTANCKIAQKYGFVASEALSIHRNARVALGNMHPSEYFPKVNKLTFHDLTKNNELPTNSNELLGLSLKFVPVPNINITGHELDQSNARFERDMGLKVFFAGDDDDASYDPKTLRVKSSWRAPLPPTEIDNRICRFQKELSKKFIRKETTPNLSPPQRQILNDLQNNKNIVILSADKGLGPVGVSTKQYVEWGLKHLLDTSTYKLLSESTALHDCDTLYRSIFQWTCKYRKDIGTDTTKYIQDRAEKARADPFGYFYLLVKLHKSPVSTRPVCSDCASLPHSIGKWVDRQLQPVVQRQPTYFKNSFDLKSLLDNMECLPTNACLFTYDAISMYTNIDTTQCMD